MYEINKMVVMSLNEELKNKLDEHDKKIEEHGKEINKLKEDVQEDRIKQVEIYTRLDNLVISVQNLTDIMKWLLFGLIGTLGSFFIWAIQNKLF